MLAEIITIGDELLMGLTVDTNSAWMGQLLTSQGFEVYQLTSISDKRQHILDAIDASMKRSDLVLVTGGLGPTSDDITKETIAEYFGSELVSNNDALMSVEKLLSARGLEMNENNRRQAMVPDNCTVLPNGKGTAPGMLFEKNGKVLIAMPGVPYEMVDIMENQVVPYIKNNFNKELIIFRLIMVYGTFEARLAEILEPFESELPAHISIAYLPTGGIIKLRLTARGKDEEALLREIDEQKSRLLSIIPEFIYGYDGDSLEVVVGKLLKSNNATLSIAESCTGGNISHMITSVPGSSNYFIGSLVAYQNDIKTRELDVSDQIINEHGAVSREVAIAMATGVRQKFRSDYSLAITGVAGPGGGTEDKPVGTVWICVSSKEKTIALKRSFGKLREQNIRRSSLAALDMLRNLILEIEKY